MRHALCMHHRNFELSVPYCLLLTLVELYDKGWRNTDKHTATSDNRTATRFDSIAVCRSVYQGCNCAVHKSGTSHTLLSCMRTCIKHNALVYCVSYAHLKECQAESM